MQATTMFKTSDGKLFENESEALAHESSIANKEAIDAFIAKHYPSVKGVKSGPSAGIARKAIALWLADQAPADDAAE